jgi:DNA primase large subunit
MLETDNGVAVLSEIEACSFRNKGPEETAEYMKSIVDKYMPLRSGTSKGQNLQDERKKDHYSHFILRLAFSSTEDLRRRFARLETMLFRLRFKDDDVRERQDFVRSLNLEWEEVKDDEKRELRDELLAAAGVLRKNDEQEWFKVDWERVPELVEQRRVLLKRGKAYVPQREQMSLVVAEFTKKLDEALEVCHCFHLLARNSLTHSTADVARPAPSRRGRSPSPYPCTSLAVLHRTRRRILVL